MNEQRPIRRNRPTFTDQEALQFHSQGRPGKLEVVATKPMSTQRDLSLAYSPGVAVPVLAIAEDPALAYDYTAKGNMVGVVSNGTAILGLGNRGALASKPVMEGKAVLFKRFADIDAFDLEVGTEDPDEVINCVRYLGPTFGGINLEDIKAPECFIIEERLRELMDIPVFHDDQHGTAIIAAAGLINALHLTGRDIASTKLVVNGAGAAGVASIELLKAMGFAPNNVILCDTKGVVYQGRQEGMNQWKSAHAAATSARSLDDAMEGADVVFGLSVKGAFTPAMIRAMAPNPIIFAMANPDPEITVEEVAAIRDDAIMATGRSDYPNQINNVLGFPYIFRGALDVRATTINMEMKIAAAQALADLAREDVPDEVAAAYQGSRPRFGRDYIIPVPFDPRLIHMVPPAVAKAAMDTGVARKRIDDLHAYKAHLSARRDPVAGTLNRIFERVRKFPKRVVFAEGEEEQVIRAAISYVNQGLGTAILVGREERIHETAEAAGIDLGGREGVEIHNARLSRRNPTYARFLYDRLQRQGYLFRDCQRMINQDRNHFAASMVALGDADAMVTGMTRNYSIALRGRAPRDRRQARPSGHRRVGVPVARAHRSRRGYGHPRDAGGAGTRRDRHRGGRRRPPPRLRSARGAALVLDLRPSQGRAGREDEGGRAHPRHHARRFRIRRRDVGGRRPQPGADGAISVLPPDRPGQRARHAGLPLGLDLDQDPAGAGRLDGDRPAHRRPRQADPDRLARLDRRRPRQHGGAGGVQRGRVTTPRSLAVSSPGLSR